VVLNIAEDDEEKQYILWEEFFANERFVTSVISNIKLPINRDCVNAKRAIQKPVLQILSNKAF